MGNYIGRTRISLDAAKEAYVLRVKDLAYTYRKQVLVPFCDEYRLVFDQEVLSWTLCGLRGEDARTARGRKSLNIPESQAQAVLAQLSWDVTDVFRVQEALAVPEPDRGFFYWLERLMGAEQTDEGTFGTLIAPYRKWANSDWR
jgi:hypothetical protein